jgi:hypothetical protein
LSDRRRTVSVPLDEDEIVVCLARIVITGQLLVDISHIELKKGVICHTSYALMLGAMGIASPGLRAPLGV